MLSVLNPLSINKISVRQYINMYVGVLIRQNTKIVKCVHNMQNCKITFRVGQVTRVLSMFGYDPAFDFV